MSNMLYCCSVLYKSRLPMVCAFNKIDAVSCNFALEWMADFEAYLSAVDESSGGEAGGDNDGEYMGSLNRSLALVMDEFYKNIGSVGVSAATGEGMEDLFAKVFATSFIVISTISSLTTDDVFYFNCVVDRLERHANEMRANWTGNGETSPLSD
ncbi:gpn1, partial [Symbiodinium microadriaticum]